MGISLRKAVMKSRANLVVLAALAACSTRPEQPAVLKADKPFVTAGNVEMQLDSGDYIIGVSRDEHIRVFFAGDIADAAADLAISGTHANLAIRKTPRSSFRATVEVPATTDITVHLTGGNLELAAITGNKEIDSKAGNVGIMVPNANDYGTVDAAVKVGNLNTGPFGNSGSGLSPHLKWSGPGKYALRASLGAGNLELKN